MAISRYPSYPVSRDNPVIGLDVRLTTSPCNKKFVDNLLREKSWKGPRLIYRTLAPLMMMKYGI
jgi:hypothetical protein